ncbi:unnamed protein product [Gemmata massiliana]|uniref:Uncharacterized protein n=1 Tax=Gemmata massiliana TaxID=1210884 RepID=A0A6P2CVU5_9BACT|nr:hypothetical protein [Gemmata massiliana]VTR92516.1 unnamed protein product [Gemmata massiliana]
MPKIKTPESAPEVPDPVTSWVTEVMFLLDELEGGSLRKLDAMSTSVPDGGDFFGAFNRVMARLGVADAVTSAYDAQRGFGYRAGNRADATGSSAALLVNRMLERVGALLTSGTNDPADPIVRREDFTHVVVLNRGVLAGRVPGMSPACPLRDVEPVNLGIEGHGYLLGDERCPWFRKSQVKALNDAENERVRRDREERERVARYEDERARTGGSRHPRASASASPNSRPRSSG